MPYVFEILHEMEHSAREANRTSGSVEREMNGRVVKCQIISAMTRRTFGYSDDVGRALWYLDGKRISRAALQKTLQRA